MFGLTKTEVTGQGQTAEFNVQDPLNPLAWESLLMLTVQVIISVCNLYHLRGHLRAPEGSDLAELQLSFS